MEYISLNISPEVVDYLIWFIAMAVSGMLAGLMAGLLGVGGGTVIVPVLFYVFTVMSIDMEVRMHMAVGTSLAIIIPTAIRSSMAHYERGTIDRVIIKSWLPWLILGVGAGSIIAGYITGEALSIIFAVCALLVALNMAINTDDKAQFPGGVPKGVKGASLAGGIGGLSTLMGIGGGTFTVPTLTAFGYPIKLAVGTSAAIGAVIALPGTVGFLIAGIGISGRPPLSLGYINLIGWVIMFPASVMLAPAGAKLAHFLPSQVVRYAFSIFLCVAAARMLYSVFS